MKKLIKFTILIVVLGVFTFSSNPIITKVRTVTVEKGKDLFQKGIDKMKDSENNTVVKIAETIE